MPDNFLEGIESLVIPPDPQAAQPAVPSGKVNRADLPALARSYAEKYGVDPDIFERQIKQESGFNQFARSKKGALGIAQFVPDTGRRYGLTRTKDFFDPHKSLDAGARHMKDLVDRYDGDYDRALAAYNAGEGAVERYGGVPPFRETREYIRAIRGNGGQKAGNLPAADLLSGIEHLVTPAGQKATGGQTPVTAIPKPPIAAPELPQDAPTPPDTQSLGLPASSAEAPAPDATPTPANRSRGIYDELVTALGLAPEQQSAQPPVVGAAPEAPAAAMPQAGQQPAAPLPGAPPAPAGQPPAAGLASGIEHLVTPPAKVARPKPTAPVIQEGRKRIAATTRELNQTATKLDQQKKALEEESARFKHNGEQVEKARKLVGFGVSNEEFNQIVDAHNQVGGELKQKADAFSQSVAQFQQRATTHKADLEGFNQDVTAYNKQRAKEHAVNPSGYKPISKAARTARDEFDSLRSQAVKAFNDGDEEQGKALLAQANAKAAEIKQKHSDKFEAEVGEGGWAYVKEKHPAPNFVAAQKRGRILVKYGEDENGKPIYREEQRVDEKKVAELQRKASWILPEQNIKDEAALDQRLKDLSDIRANAIAAGQPVDAVDAHIRAFAQIKNDVARARAGGKMTGRSPSEGGRPADRPEDLPWYLKGYVADLAYGLNAGAIGMGNMFAGGLKGLGISRPEGMDESLNEATRLNAETASRGGEGVGHEFARAFGNLATRLPVYASTGPLGWALMGGAEAAAKPDALPQDVIQAALVNFAIGKILKAGHVLSLPKRILLGGSVGAGFTAAEGGTREQIIAHGILFAGLGAVGGLRRGQRVEDNAGNQYRVEDVGKDRVRVKVERVVDMEPYTDADGNIAYRPAGGIKGLLGPGEEPGGARPAGGGPIEPKGPKGGGAPEALQQHEPLFRALDAAIEKARTTGDTADIRAITERLQQAGVPDQAIFERAAGGGDNLPAAKPTAQAQPGATAGFTSGTASRAPDIRTPSKPQTEIAEKPQEVAPLAVGEKVSHPAFAKGQPMTITSVADGKLTATIERPNGTTKDVQITLDSKVGRELARVEPPASEAAPEESGAIRTETVAKPATVAPQVKPAPSAQATAERPPAETELEVAPEEAIAPVEKPQASAPRFKPTEGVETRSEADVTSDVEARHGKRLAGLSPELFARWDLERRAAAGESGAIAVFEGRAPFKFTPDGQVSNRGGGKMAPQTRGGAYNALKEAIDEGRPVNAALLDGVNARMGSHPLVLEGYVRKGELFVKAEASDPASPTEKSKPGSWFNDNSALLAAGAEKSGMADKIEALAAAGKTTKTIVRELGIKKAVVDAVKSVRNIPGLDDQIEYQKWLKGYFERQRASVDVAAQQAATSPTNARPQPTVAQSEAGNFKMGHARIGGLDVSIENPAGTKRKPEWPTLKSHYGYLKRTTGADEEHIDVFIKQGTPTDYSGPVFVVDQQNADGSFDEHKAMLGFATEAEARKGYSENYTPDWKVGPITEFASPTEFKEWLNTADTTKPVSGAQTAPSGKVNMMSAPRGRAPSPGVKRLIEEKRKVEIAAALDVHTGLQNKNQWIGAQKRIEADPNREIVALDINDLKKFNDQVGHDAGDEYIAHVGQAVLAEAAKLGVTARQAYRIGGDELMIDAPKDKGAQFLKAVKARVAEFEREGIKGSVAGGVGATAKQADTRLYADKKIMKAGRGKAPAAKEPLTATQQKAQERITAAREKKAELERFKAAEGEAETLAVTAREKFLAEEKPAPKTEAEKPKGRPSRADAIRLAQEAAQRKEQAQAETKQKAQKKIEAAKAPSKQAEAPTTEAKAPSSTQIAPSSAPVAKRQPSRVTKSPAQESRRQLIESLNDDDLWDEPELAALGYSISPLLLKEARESKIALADWDGDYLALNAAGTQALTKAYGSTLRGLTLKPAQATKLAAKARVLAGDARGIERDNLLTLAGALEDAAADREEFGIGLPTSLLHEVGHVAQLALQRFFGKDILVAQARRVKHYAKLAKGINEKGYTWLTDPRAIVHEAYAHVANGQRKEIGLNAREAIEFAESYYNLIADTYRTDALKRFNRLNDELLRLRDETIKKREAAAQRDAQKQRGAIQAAPKGRPRRSRQAPGQERAGGERAREDIATVLGDARSDLAESLSLLRPRNLDATREDEPIAATERWLANAETGIATRVLIPLLEKHIKEARFPQYEKQAREAMGFYLDSLRENEFVRSGEEEEYDPPANLGAVPLPPRVVTALVEITRNFIESGETDFDLLMNEIEQTVSADKFGRISPHLPEIINAAYDMIETAEGEADEKQVATRAEETQTPASFGISAEAARQPIYPPRKPNAAPSVGAQTSVRIPGTNQELPARYSVRELSDVYPSHNPFNFQPNPDYELVNDRHYDREKAYQQDIIEQSKPENFIPKRLINNSDTVETGPPVIDSNGNVGGGNSRTMMLTRYYDAGAGADYKAELLRQASIYGLDVKEFATMKRPVLVRELTDSALRAQDVITALNVSGTRALTPTERAVSEAGKLNDAAIDFINGKLEAAGDDATLAQVLDRSGVEIVNRLIDDGVFAPQERNALVKDGALLPEAKSRINRLMLGRIFRDLDQLERAPDSIKRNAERIIAPLTKLSTIPQWDITDEVRGAIDLVSEARASGQNQTLEAFNRTPSMFRQAYTPREVALGEALQAGVVKTAKMFRSYANDALSAQRGGGLFGATSPAQAFADAFGMAEPIEAPKPAAAPERKTSPLPGLGTLEAPSVVGLSRVFMQDFLEGERFGTIVEARQRAGELLGGQIKPGTVAVKAVDEAVELGVVRAARRLVAEGMGAVDTTYDRMVELYEQQPTLGSKTSTSVRNQAYSTPAPIAYVASRLAGIDQDTTVYEPTAGNGILLIEAAPKNIIANEYNQERFANLKQSLPGASVFPFDAAEMRPLENRRLDVVIANPPFGVVKDEQGESKVFTPTPGYRTTEIDHAIALKALEGMKDNGRAVLIVGGVNARDEAARSDGYNGKSKRAFYYTLYNDYNVTDHFTVDGDLYKKQGAGWPVDVIVINGRGKSSRALPAADVPRIYDSFDALKEVLSGTQQRSGVGTAGQRGAGGARSDTGESGPAARPDDVLEPAGGSLREPAETGTRPAGGARPGVSSIASGRTGGVEAPARGGGQRTGIQQPGATGGALSEGSAGQTAENAPEGQRQGTEATGRNEPGPVAEPAARPPRQPRQVDVAETQIPYRPHSEQPSAGTLVPANMATATGEALAALSRQVGNLDDFVASELDYNRADLSKYFNAEQIDALALAIRAMQTGAGFIIGDQTGLGKGRVVAGIMRYALRTGRTPIFVTEKPNLYKDIYRDLVDIGQEDLRPMMTNAGERIALTDDESVMLKSKESKAHRAQLQEMAASRDLGDHNIIFTTYSQMQTVKGARTARMDFLDAFAQGGVLILDESHNAGGTEVDPRQADEMNRAKFTRGLVNKASGVFYSSATYAKRPQVMDLYSKTDMRLAVAAGTLAAAIERGGVPLQQAVASQLVESGQYIRRERSFDGIRYNTKPVAVDRRTAESISGVMRAIRGFDQAKQAAIENIKREVKAEAKAILGESATGSAGVHSTNFTSLMRNLVDQMLLGLKADAAIAEALDALKRGEKPVVTVANTMGSFIQHYVEENDLKPGDAIALNFGDMLLRYLERSRDVLIGNAYGQKTRKRLTDGDLGPMGVAAFNAAKKLIEQTDFGNIPVSPIDYIKSKLEAEGYKTGEITGRSATVDYKGTVKPREWAEPEAPKLSATSERRFSDWYAKAYAEDPSFTRMLKWKEPQAWLEGYIEVFRDWARALASRDQRYTREEILETIDRAIAQDLDPVLGKDVGQQFQAYWDALISKPKSAPEGSPVYRIRPGGEISIAGRNRTITRFNNGETDVMILNQAGATGLSLHASEKFRDQRKRHMIIAQAERNIDTHMQMLGRVHRTGQVVLPEFTQLAADIPAEKRPAAILAKKMASLNANTTAARGSAVTAKDVTDFMNDYGDEIAAELMNDNPDLHRLLGNPLPPNDMGEGLKVEGAIRKVTGRIPLLRIKEQEELYDLIESEYNDLITRLDAMGENALEAKTLDLDARPIKKTTVFEGAGDRPFTRSAQAETMDVRLVGKPYTSAEVLTILNEHFGTTGKDFETLQDEGESESEQRATEIDRRFREYRREVLDEIEDEQRRRAKSAMLDAQKERLDDALDALPVGATVQMVSESGIYYGIVTKVEQKGNPKNPVALGSWKVTFAVADSMRRLTVPASRIGGEGARQVIISRATDTGGLFDKTPILEFFDKSQQQSREQRVIITGNLLAGFGRFKAGKIVNFTDAQGDVRQGILMPRDWSVEKAMDEEPVDFATADQILGFIDSVSGIVRSNDKALSISKRGADYRLFTPASKAAGGRYFLNQLLTQALGRDFVKSGDVMQAVVARADAVHAIRMLQSQGVVFQTDTFKPRAREITGKPAPEELPDLEPQKWAYHKTTEEALRGMLAEGMDQGDFTTGKAIDFPGNVTIRVRVEDIPSPQIGEYGKGVEWYLPGYQQGGPISADKIQVKLGRKWVALRDYMQGSADDQPFADLAPPDDREGERGFATPEILGVKAAIESAQKVAEVVRSARDDFRKVFNPAARSAEARTTAETTREYAARKQQRIDQVEAATRRIRKFFAGRAQADNYQFIDRMERGYAQGSPALDDIALLFREILDVDRSEVQGLGTGKLEDFIENYFPRYWDKSKQPAHPESEGRRARPLQGSKSFLKRRSYEFFQDGIDNGEVPLSDNPTDFLLWKHAEMQQYIAAHRILGEMKNSGTAQFARSFDKAPDGWTTPKDNLFAVWGRSEEGERVLRGHYYVPEPAARIIDNYTSKGLRDKLWFRSYTSAANHINQMQLSFSAFHATFVMTDAIISNVALAIYQASHGHPIKATGTLAKSPVAPILYLLEGRRVRQEWLEPGRHPELTPLVDAMIAGGGRSQMDTFYNTEMGKRLMDAFRQGAGVGVTALMKPSFVGLTGGALAGSVVAGPVGALVGGLVGSGALRTLFSAAELASAPLLKWLVPNLKAGAIAAMARIELERLGTGASRDAVRERMANVVDSVDNRMGQMIYDNLFWNKVAKDLGMASVRSLGWNLGDLREFGGGFLDSLRFVRDAALYPVRAALGGGGRGSGGVGGSRSGGVGGGAGTGGTGRGGRGDIPKPEFTHRMAYMIALPLVAGLIGAILMYLMTGKKPKELKDYFYPQTGGTDEQGDPERIMIASYMKDIYPLIAARSLKEGAGTAGTMAAHKLHPMLTMMAEMLQNRNYYGTEIRNSDDPFIQQAKDAATHVAEGFMPFGVRGVLQGRERGTSSARSWLPMLGVTPAPRSINQTAAEKMVREFEQEARPQGTRTKAEAERAKLKARSTRAVVAGDQAGIKTMEAARKAGLLTDTDMEQIAERAKESPVARGFKGLKLDQALKVWGVATEEEKRILKPLLEKKSALLENLPDEQRQKSAAALGSALGLNEEEVRQQVAASRHSQPDATPTERQLLARVDDAHDEAKAELASSADFKALTDAQQKDALRRLILQVGHYALTKEEREGNENRRERAAQGKINRLEQQIAKGYFLKLLPGIIKEARRATP